VTHRVLITAPYFQPVLPRFIRTFENNGIELVVPEVRERLSAEELMPLVGDIDGAICGDDGFTKAVLDHACRLRVISKWGTGVDSIDRDECMKRGIAVCNTPNAFSEPVADTTLGYILCLLRELSRLSCDVRGGVWTKHPAPALSECVIGLIGIGNVGRAVARRLAPFGARILASDPIAPPEPFRQECRVEMVEKRWLLEQSDVVSLHCDLNPSSLHIIDAEALSLMKPTGFLVNTARGRLVDEGALAKALERKIIAGAALDVFEVEPLPAHSPLCSMENVLLSSHNANSSPGAWERVHHNTVQNLLAHLHLQQ